jgi:hypothetical protein
VPVVDLSKPIGDPERVREFTQAELDQIEALREAAPFVALPPALVGAARCAVIAPGLISGFSGAGFGNAVRVSMGRVRFMFDPPQPDNDYFPIAVPLNSGDITARISNWTAFFVEVRTNAVAGVYPEAAGFAVQVTRKV